MADRIIDKICVYIDLFELIERCFRLDSVRNGDSDLNGVAGEGVDFAGTKMV